MWIKEIAEKLIRKYNTNDPFEIASAKNINVYEFDLPDEVYGLYKYIRRNKFIYINSKLNQNEKRFTCAHELGHSELHPRLNTPFLKRKTYYSANKIEVEANRFAVELLMPDDVIYETSIYDRAITVDEFSDLHGVPKEVSHLKKME